MPLPRRFLTAAMLRYNGSSLLIDCGEGTQVAIKEKGLTFKPLMSSVFTITTEITSADCPGRFSPWEMRTEPSH